MGEVERSERLLICCLLGLALAMFVVAWNPDWSGGHAGAAAASLVFSLALVGAVASTAARRRIVYLVSAFALSIGLLASIHHDGHPSWTRHLPATPGADAVLWQVQTTFLSVGFAGLAIAAQLFAETPLAIGASRGRILEYVRAGWFVSVSLFANFLIAVETIWFPSNLGVLVVAVAGFVPSLVLLVMATVRLMRLFGNPSLLDAVVRASLIETLASRLDNVSRTYAGARRQMDGIGVLASTQPLGPGAVTLRVPVPRAGLVIKTIKAHLVRRAIASLTPKATENQVGGISDGSGVLYSPVQITLTVEPGDRTRMNETAFRVTTSDDRSGPVRDRLVRLLQSSIEFEALGSVTLYEETDREIANLKDTIGGNLRSGTFGTAERALDLLGEVVRGVWTARPETLDSSRRASFTRRDWLFRAIGETEQDALLSPRAAGLFVDHAMTRALEAPRTGSTEYVDECLRSFTRLWLDVLTFGGSEFDSVPPRILTCVENLASYVYSTEDQRDGLHARAIWAMVELVKGALDARRHGAARMAARELNGLFEYSDRPGDGRAHVRGGQLVLSGWLDYLADRGDERYPADPELRALLTPRGTWPEILAARTLAERGVAPFSRWDWWEMSSTNSGRAQVLQLSSYIDRAQLTALASSYGSLPPALDQETASEYERFKRLLDEGDRVLSKTEDRLKERFADEVDRWNAAENERLAREPLSEDKIAALQTALRDTLNDEQRLAAAIPMATDVPGIADKSRPILGLNFRVPRHYLVDKIFSQTYANPSDLGEVFARGLMEGEERRILEVLRSQPVNILKPTATLIFREIEALGDNAGQHVLVTPYGGLHDLDDWYTIEFREALSRVTHVESGALEDEAFLFDRRYALLSRRVPEDKVGLAPVEGTSIALGVIEDVQSDKEPQVRIEIGEYFVVWAGDTASIRRFASPVDG